ncbi:Hypothetical protein SRAE_X000087000 [Strongyloides ratti]|uniref:Uncharacterized protein n=1 Tax=Strongyloides ratti TaxID=34506 RepID=A0A090LP54_STRRB|nr:Hypothetical protein SRAE_X000087000 [Strongyloides ratti]CEF71546.1 Hypothetical protein SRAE_X000087000 [Strongyloides ratti]
MKFVIFSLLFLVAVIVAHKGFHNHFYPQWGYYPQPYHSGYYFPSINYPLHTLWNPGFSFPPYEYGWFNPWGHHHRHHNFHHNYFPHHHFGHGYNFADRYAYHFFKRHGFNVKAALYFCNSHFTRPIVWHSAYLFNYCTFINQNYGRWNKYVPNYPNVPEGNSIEGQDNYQGYSESNSIETNSVEPVASESTGYNNNVQSY